MKKLFSWLLLPLRYSIDYFLFNIFDKKIFNCLFYIINNVYYKYPVTIKYETINKLYSIKDKDSILFVGHRRRVKMYKNGINTRLNFLINQYLLSDFNISPNDIVIDIGSNIGEFAYYMAKYRKAKVICIEPEIKEFNALKINCNHLNVKPLNMALWSEETELILYQKNETGDSSLIEPDGYNSKKTITTTTLNTIVSNNLKPNERIKLVKLEAEGAEPEILMGAMDVIDRIDYIVADIGPERGKKSESTLIEVLEILQKHNFVAIKFGYSRGILLFENKCIK